MIFSTRSLIYLILVLLVFNFLTAFIFLEPSVLWRYGKYRKLQILKHLYECKAFLIDIKVLNEISNNPRDDYQSNFNEIILNKPMLTFGIFNNDYDLKRLNDLNVLTTLEASLFILYSDDGMKQQTSLYIISNECRIQISIFYKRGNFLWIGSDNGHQVTSSNEKLVLYHNDEIKWFGDTPRAFNNFDVRTLINGQVVVQAPLDIKNFLFQYDYSKFIECNETIRDENFKASNGNFAQNEIFNGKMMPVLSHIGLKLEQNYVRYWLAGGTLLGWYRDCGLIPHTTDADLYIHRKDYIDNIPHMFRGDQNAPLYKIMGLANDSREFRILLHKTQVDIFVIYDFNSTHQTAGFHSNREKFRRWLPTVDKLCTGEILKYKFIVPCDPEKLLTFEYGKRELWMKPMRKGYRSLGFDRKSVYWSDDEWPNVLKYYLVNGDFDEKKTFLLLKKYAKKPLPQLSEY